MRDLPQEAKAMPQAAIRFARGVGFVKTPEHLVPLRDYVREKRSGDLRAVHAAINERFGTTGASTDYVNVLYAASEMAVMAEVGDDLSGEDKRLLFDLWDTLLAAT